MKKRILSILLMCCMVLTLLPVTALAEDSAYTVGEDTGVSARALAGTAGTKLKADNIATYIANGLGGGVYTLAEDVTISGTLRVTGEATVDLNGHILRYAEEAEPDSIFRVTSGSTLTLTDSRPEAEHEDKTLPAGGLITGGRGYRHDNGAGQAYIYYGGGVYVETGASFMLAGGTIYACGVQSGAFQAFGGGIYADGGSVTMSGGAIRNCAVSGDYGASGGAIYAKAGSVTMTSGVISGCSAMDGGGILTSGCTVQITGGRIENCKATNNGGGLSVSGHTNGPVSVLDTVISGCEAKRGGGVALIAFAELELGENARITGCTATEKDDTEAGAIEYGAAIYMDLDSTYTVTVNGATVELDESDSFRLAPANGGQKIIVADKAGNTTEMTVTVNDGHTYGEWASNGDGTHTRKCTVDGCAGSETKDCSGGRATCRDKAKCAVCGAEYGKLDAKNHADLKHIPAKAATWVAEGNIEYWYCEGCGRYFSDRDGTKEIRKADTVTAKRKSSSAAAKPEDDPKSPGTGDTSNLALWIALLFASGGAAIGTTVVSRRKKYNR